MVAADTMVLDVAEKGISLVGLLAIAFSSGKIAQAVRGIRIDLNGHIERVEEFMGDMRETTSDHGERIVILETHAGIDRRHRARRVEDRS